MSLPFENQYGGTSIAQYYDEALSRDPRMVAINRNISGQIAPDVRNQIAQAAAERGVGVGSYGGGNDQSSMLRALGLTSMGITNQGISQYGDAYNSVPKLDPTSLFVNPTTIFNDTAGLRDLQLKLAQDKAQQDAQRASEEKRFYANLGQQASQFGASFGSSQKKFDQERADALSGIGKTDATLQGIIDRNSGGGGRTGGGGGRTGGGGAPTVAPSPFPYGGGAQSDFMGDPNNLWARPSDYEFGYTGPASSPDPYSSNAWEPSAQDWSNFDNLDYSGGYGGY